MRTNQFFSTNVASPTPTPRQPHTIHQRLGRRVSASWILPLLLLLPLPAAVQAQDYAYTTYNGTITITGYTGPGGAVTIPSTINGLPVTSIGDRAFYFCSSLTSVTIPNSVTTIGDGAFNFCSSLTSVAIGNSVTNLGDEAFAGCKSLATVTIGNSVTTIGGSAFAGCKSLTSVTIPNSVTTIGDGAFYFCSSLTSVTIGNSVTNLGASAFAGCKSLTTVTIPNSVTSIRDGTFQKCTGLTGITIPTSVTSIGEVAFSECTSLTSIAIPNSVTNIGDEAFYSCASLTSFTVPASVISIGDSAFQECTSLTNLTIGNGVTRFGNQALLFCPSLTAIAVDALNSVYSSVDGVLFNKSRTVLIQCPAGKAGTYTIPNTVNYIGGEAFFLCASLTSVTIPNSVNYIGQNAFAYCTSLTSVTMGTGVIGILYGAFSYCTNLTSVTMPNRVNYIGYYAFVSCTSLTGVYFQGNAPSYFDSFAFTGADGVTIYYLPGTMGWGPTFGRRPTVLWQPPVADVTGTQPMVISANGINAKVVLDGTRSLDPNGELLQYAWYEVGNPNAVAGGAVSVVVLPVGAHSLLLVVNDGMLSATNAFTVEVITTAQATEHLIAQVNSTWPRPRPLVATLSAARASIEGGNTVSAISQLAAFQNKVRAQIDPMTAEPLIKAAQDVIDALGSDNTVLK